MKIFALVEKIVIHIDSVKNVMLKNPRLKIKSQ